MIVSLINNLENLPLTSPFSKSYIWADYIELLCLTNIDSVVSKADIQNYIWQKKDLGELDSINFEDMIDTPFLLDDKKAQQTDDWFKHLHYRMYAFKEFYPFVVQGNSLYCLETLNLKQKLYLFLLLASNLKYITQAKRDYFSSYFEGISLLALKSYLPQPSKVYLFGKNRLNKGRYRGKLWQRINKLAIDIGEMPLCTETDFDPKNTGDGGLDLVAWLPFGDKSTGFLLVFAQCTCTPNWSDKQFQSHKDNWSDYLTFKVPPNNMVFIPFCFRGIDDNWYDKFSIKQNILVDRLRLVYLLNRNFALLEKSMQMEKEIHAFFMEYFIP